MNIVNFITKISALILIGCMNVLDQVNLVDNICTLMKQNIAL